MPRTPKPRRWRPGVLKNLLQRDVVDMLVLILLNRRAMYGREIIRYLAALTDNVLIYDKLNVPLSRLERQGFIQVTNTPLGGDRARVYFVITELGQKHLQEMTEDYRLFAEAMGKVVDAPEL
ncbi:PadR family transcriptional regulator [uncultured Gemmiger sp.]|uniref:PadR family transcriptional regulator n=1 Tax=uncultured Gemmiger sp. TaxID=1623490 RepID=UPI0025DAFACB|nr:PadR family transcriptional regulator [uncultured Gemmiger sp.]